MDINVDPNTEPMLGTTASIIVVTILVILSGFFAGAETALTGVSKNRMHALAKEGNKMAALVNKIREKKDNMIGAIMLGNTAVQILASAIAAGLLVRMFGETGVLYASAGMTVIVLIFGEVLPKTYALYHADSVSMTIAPLIRAVIFVFSPITTLITAIVRFFLSIFGMDTTAISTGQHLEALRGAIDLHRGPEEEIHEQRAMLRSILDLQDVNVEDIMIHRKNITMIDMSQSIDQVVEAVLNSPYTRIPIWKENPDNIIGVLHAKHLLRELRRHREDTEQIDLALCSMEPWFIPETTSLYDQLQAFRERKEHFAMVVDEYGALMGIVTLEDILEEIVGEIDDEHDLSMPGVRKLTGGAYMVDGAVTIRDLNREFNWNLPDEEYSTLAGLIIYESQMIPDVGQSFRFHNMRMDIVRRQRNQIKLIRVTPAEPETAGS